MNYHQAQSELRYKIALKLADRNEAMTRWRDQLRGLDLYSDAGLFERLADVISPMYEFLAKAQNPRSLGMRAWSLLYAVRPDLIEHETIQAAADRFGVTQEALCYQLRQLEAAFPGFTYLRRKSPPPDILRERMQKASRGRVERFRQRAQEVA